MSIEAMKLALDFISRLKFADAEPEPDKVMQALRTAIEQAEKQEPVGVVVLDTSRPFVGGTYDGKVIPWTQAPVAKTVLLFKDLPLNTSLYTAPPQREWQGLTDEEIGRLTVFDGLHHVEVPLLADFARAIEAKLKEKNT